MRTLVGQIVVDEFPDLPDGLAELGDVEVLPTYRLDPSVVGMIGRFGPDVVVVGQYMPDIAFLFNEYLRQANSADAKVVVGARGPTNVLKIKAAHAGFHDVVDLDRPIEEVRVAIRNSHAGIYALDADLLWRNVARPPRHHDLELVTRDGTDVEILNLIAIGLSDQEIAEAVYMSAQTVRNRVSQMLIRSGLGNRTQLAWIFTHRNLLHRIVVGNGLSKDGS